MMHVAKGGGTEEIKMVSWFNSEGGLAPQSRSLTASTSQWHEGENGGKRGELIG